MDFITTLLTACGSVQKASNKSLDEELASEIQLNAFELRNYRTNLDPQQQQVLERVVNSWCSMLVKGKTMKVEGIGDLVYLDKDLLTLETNHQYYPLKAMNRIEFFKDGDDLMTGAMAPYGLDITFEGGMGDVSLKFNFEQERSRLQFALTLRILRTRDPTLDPTSNVVVDGRDGDEEDEPLTFNRIVNAQHYNIEKGIPIVFSVSDLKLYHKLQSSSRHTYLEFFVRYPSQERFVYAKSPTTHLPQQVLQTEDAALRRKKETKDDAAAEEEKKKEELKKQVLGDEIPICAMRFELKNVKLKIPKVPHQIFGRLMARDDYFPTAIATFDFQVTKHHLQNRMKDPDEKKKAAQKKEKDLPETMRIPCYSSWKVKAEESKKEDAYLKVGTLTLRLMGYVTEPERSGASPTSTTSPTSPTSPLATGPAEEQEEAEGDSPVAASPKGTEKDEEASSASGASDASGSKSSKSS